MFSYIGIKEYNFCLNLHFYLFFKLYFLVEYYYVYTIFWLLTNTIFYEQFSPKIFRWRCSLNMYYFPLKFILCCTKNIFKNCLAFWANVVRKLDYTHSSIGMKLINIRDTPVLNQNNWSCIILRFLERYTSVVLSYREIYRPYWSEKTWNTSFFHWDQIHLFGSLLLW